MPVGCKRRFSELTSDDVEQIAARFQCSVEASLLDWKEMLAGDIMEVVGTRDET
jgi:hypothetical protein